MDTKEMQKKLREFARERDWEVYHTPKNLVMALSGEVGELVEIFQWLTPEEATKIMLDEAKALHVKEEVADVLSYILRIADILNIDLKDAMSKKIEKNAAKYPVHLAKGNAKKYREF